MMTINLDDLTIGQVKQITSIQGGNKKDPFTKYLGKALFIRTITMYYMGRLDEVYDNELVLSECSWIPDTGRFHDALKNGTASEVEPYVSDQVIIGRGAILDVCEWTKDLLKVQK